MTDWDKLKVTELKDELKARGIPLTGLKLKQQLIDKLVEIDANAQKDENTAEEKTNGAIGEVEKDESAAVIQPEDPQTTRSDEQEDGIADEENNVKSTEKAHSEPTEKPLELQQEDHRATIETPQTEEQSNADIPIAKTEIEATDIQARNILVPQPEQIDVGESPPAEQESTGDIQTESTSTVAQDTAKRELDNPQPETKPTEIVPSGESTPQVAPHEIIEDRRKRKRRSVTPTPSLTEVIKKAKSATGEARVTRTGSSREASTERDQTNEQTLSLESTDHESKVSSQHADGKNPGEKKSRSPSEQSDIAPALHPATKSLYIRGFKRPLHIPTLRSHISGLARPPSSDTEEDLVKFFYLDSIRTHAFVTFANIPAASRVRNAMHNARFPDEPQREPLWIDFVPDNKVQNWADQESGGGGGGAFGRSGARGKFEVIYDKMSDGTIKAVLQEVDSNAGLPQRSSFSQRQQSFSSVDPTKTSAVASGVHPDRAAIVPISPTLDRRTPRDRRNSPPASGRPLAREPNRDSGTGFAPLDRLFSSTTTKPKLYFKPPPQTVVDERLNLIQDLFPDRGISGDPGMKRYTFEPTSDRTGRQEWVDAGPEFGHGRKGQDRLVGTFGGGRGGGGFRSRGGGGRGGGFGRGRGGRPGGDSYRGPGSDAGGGVLRYS